jgi:hypothetical protein
MQDSVLLPKIFFGVSHKHVVSEVSFLRNNYILHLRISFYDHPSIILRA